MTYGHFDDAAREYVIETPATPLPWINYLGNEGFFGLISNTAGGYNFYKDAKLRRITRYRYNNVPTDNGGRYYYIKDGDTVWNPGFLPCRTELDSYVCRHGLGYTVIAGSKNNISAEMTFFVPQGENCEINKMVLTNTGSAKKTITLFSALEWCLWNAVDDSTNFQRNWSTGEVEIKGSTIYHKTEYRERRDHYAYFSVNAAIDGYDTDRDTFLGQFNNWDTPDVVKAGKATNSKASGWAPIASHQINVTLNPGESKTFIFTLGYAELPLNEKWESHGIINKKPAETLLNKFSTVETVDKALADLKNYWTKLLSTLQMESSDKKLDRMLNIWNQYQCMVTFNMSRSASYYESGTGRGMGFRDSCQDLLGFVHLIPERARDRIIDIASIQFEDGSTYHQYQPLTKRGNGDIGGGFNDDPLWLVACTAAYIKETGDDSILNAPVPFNNVPGSEKPLMEHLRRSVMYTVNHKGPHGLPLIGRADWNDCLNLNCFSMEPGESFQTSGPSEGPIAESVFIGGMFVLYGREYAELCRRFGDAKESELILAEVDKINDAVKTAGWDGEWFLRAYDHYKNKVGTHETKEAQIYIEPQGMCVMAGIGVKEGLAAKALASVKERLTTKYGTCILAPCYTEYHKELGEITSYPPGYKENGGIFCHNNPWISIAETVIGDAEEAFGVYKRTCPAYLEEISDIHRTEPYVYSQMVGGIEAPHFGEAKNSWLTGTAAWTFVNVSQYIVGIRPAYEGLEVCPCIPKELKGFKATRIFRGAKYNITVENKGTGKPTLTVDGTPINGTVIPFQPGKKEYNVTVAL